MSEDTRLLQINCCIKLQLDSPVFFPPLNSTVPGLYMFTGNSYVDKDVLPGLSFLCAINV